MRKKWTKKRRIVSGCAITSALVLFALCSILGIVVIGAKQSVWIGDGTSYLAIERLGPGIELEEPTYLGSPPIVGTGGQVTCGTEGSTWLQLGDWDITTMKCQSSP